MNRPIKFRAWDKNDRRFLSEDDNVPNFLNLVPCQSTGQFIPMYMEIAESYIYDTDIILMQYTGLKDRSGKEIFEGDIVKGINLENFEWIEPVTFIDNGWFPFIEHRAMTDFEVIGNIYENPELLKGSP